MASRATQYRAVEPAAIEQRRAMRHAVAVSRASLRKRTEQPCEATLADLSVYGCRLVSTATLKADERVWLRFAGSLPIAATVVWSGSGAIGCRFDAPIERSLLRALVLTPA